ncbi:MAG TPA: TIGR04551 family protein [Kofleriaceae bacterium]|nr:TIGR04551 family protein [Kofleriaceae bacterium]
MRFSHPLTSAAVLAALLSSAVDARAQVSPQGGQPMPGTEPLPEGDKKPEGVAEPAPTQPGQLPTTPILPAPKARKKRFQLFEIDGYFRWRGDWMKNLNLGFTGQDSMGNDNGLGIPYPRSLSCAGDAPADAPCSGTIKSSNIRLRLEPVINIDERSSVHFQIDVLDNLVLGSTPDGSFNDGTARPTNIPINAFSGGQADPQAGRNYLTDSIRVKQAWAEVMTPLGLLRFGRMPSHWGMGILANAGGKDPFHGTYDLDADYGDTADRLMFGTMIPGTDLRVAVGTDWAATTPTAAQSDIWRNRYDGQPFDLDDADDVNQWLVVLARLDSPEDFQDLRDQGEVAFNYGAYFVYRTQGWDYNPSLTLGGGPSGLNVVRRDAKAYIPDAWVHIGHKKLEFEAEAVAVIGSIGELDDVASALDQGADVREFGGVAKVGYKMVQDKLRLGFEAGFASGDKWPATVPGRTNVRDARTIPCFDLQPGETCNDHTINNFRFDMDYKVDLILFRELLGTVTNALYLKPTLSYDLTRSITFKAASVVSFAAKPASTPGNGDMYGVEFDGDLGYENEGFFAGIAYGVLFPLSAMNHSADLFGEFADAGTAHTIQSRLVLQF